MQLLHSHELKTSDTQTGVQEKKQVTRRVEDPWIHVQLWMQVHPSLDKRPVSTFILSTFQQQREAFHWKVSKCKMFWVLRSTSCKNINAHLFTFLSWGRHKSASKHCHDTAWHVPAASALCFIRCKSYRQFPLFFPSQGGQSSVPQVSDCPLQETNPCFLFLVALRLSGFCSPQNML